MNDISRNKNISPKCKFVDTKEAIGIVGLGLIGGSLAKAIRSKTDCRLFGNDICTDSLSAALDDGVIDGELTEETLAQCSLVLVCLYPDDVIFFCKSNMKSMKKGTVIVDCAGVKTRICKEVSALAKDLGLTFFGGHPMAGIERSGYSSSFAELFKGATMILCESKHQEEKILKELGLFFTTIGFANIKVTTAEEHDKIIAYTSQLAHLVSSAYIKSDTVNKRYGFSAGSFKDLTRVARLDTDMWTELFFENRENLLNECDKYIENVKKYRDALRSQDESAMKELLKIGTELKITDDRNEREWLTKTSGKSDKNT